MRLSLAQKVTLPLLSFGGQLDALEYLQSLGDWAALWDLQEKSTYGPNVLPDGDMEAPTTAAWTAIASTLSKQTTNPQSGIRLLRVAVAAANGYARQLGILDTGKRYRITGYARSDGALLPQVAASPYAALWTGTNSTAWQFFDVEFSSADGIRFYAEAGGGTGYSEFDTCLITEVTNESGLVALAYNNEIPVGRQVAIDGDMEAATTGAYQAVSAATLTKEAGTPHGGTQSLRVAYNGTNNPVARQTIVASGKTWTASVWARSDGSRVPRLYLAGNNFVSGTTSTSWQFLTITVTAIQATTALVDLMAVASGAGYCEFDDFVVQQTGILASENYPGAEELVDGDMEAAGTAAWTAIGAPTVLSKEAVNPHSGTQVLRVTDATGGNPIARQTVLTVGLRYRFIGWARSDGNTTPRLTDAVSVLWSGVNTHTNWQPFDFEAIATGTGYSLLVTSGTATWYAEWDDCSVTPANPLNGGNDGATVNQPLQPGIVAYSFDSVNDEVDVKSAELNSGITPLAGTMVALFKIGTAVWEDSTIRTLFRIYVDATNYITMKKGANVGEVIASYAGEGAAAVDIAHSTLSPLGTMSMITTFDIVANELKMYLQGTQDGATGVITAVMLGNITSAVIGSTGAGEYWDELVAHVGFMRRLMTATEIATYTGMLNLESGTAFNDGFDEGFI